MMIPEYVWLAVTIFLAVCIIYVAQRIIMSAQLTSILNTGLKSILDTNTSKEKTTSEEDEDLDGSDDPDLDDFLD